MHYKTRYDKLISHYQLNPTDGMVEKHHILPKCMGGDDKITNLVLLPTRAHFIAHYLLHKAYPEDRSLAHAFAMMGVCNGYQHRNSRLYEKSKLARSKAMTGLPRPEWVKEKMRKPKSSTENYKKPKSDQHAKNISKSLVGKKKSEQHIKNMIQSQRKYQEKRTRETQQKILRYRKLFVESDLKRNAFFALHNLNPNTGKRYLKGL